MRGGVGGGEEVREKGGVEGGGEAVGGEDGVDLGGDGGGGRLERLGFRGGRTGAGGGASSAGVVCGDLGKRVCGC